MGLLDLSPYSFLVVDDAELCRVDATAVLEACGAKRVYCAEDGLEAADFLEGKDAWVDCVIADYQMPRMNGLQLLKVVRSGRLRAPRDISFALITGRGDRDTIERARALDASAFLLKPLTADAIDERLGKALRQEFDAFWIKPDHVYGHVDLGSDEFSFTEIRAAAAAASKSQSKGEGVLIESRGAHTEKASQALDSGESLESEEAPSASSESDESSPPALESDSEPGVPDGEGRAGSTTDGTQYYSIDDVPVNVVLDQDIRAVSGKVLYRAGTLLTAIEIVRLKELKKIDFWSGDILAIPKESRSAHRGESGLEGLQQMESAGDTSDSSSTEIGLHRTTYSLYGKLRTNSVVSCTQCATEFAPTPDLLRRHNRRELISLLCAPCNTRADELLCACARLMVGMGGFPVTIIQLLEAFTERDSVLPKEKCDPFHDLRESYAESPLTEDDVVGWVHMGYLKLNLESHQVECMIDRILSTPERALLLGKDGVAAKHMAQKRTDRLR